MVSFRWVISLCLGNEKEKGSYIAYIDTLQALYAMDYRSSVQRPAERNSI